MRLRVNPIDCVAHGLRRPAPRMDQARRVGLSDRARSRVHPSLSSTPAAPPTVAQRWRCGSTPRTFELSPRNGPAERHRRVRARWLRSGHDQHRRDPRHPWPTEGGLRGRAPRPSPSKRTPLPPSYPRLLAAALGSSPTGFVPAVSWRGQTAVWISRPPSGVALLAFDQRLLELRLHSGTVDAGGSGWRFGPAVLGTEPGRLVAAFNGGFKFSTGAGGFQSYGASARRWATGSARSSPIPTAAPTSATGTGRAGGGDARGLGAPEPDAPDQQRDRSSEPGLHLAAGARRSARSATPPVRRSASPPTGISCGPAAST